MNEKYQLICSGAYKTQYTLYRLFLDWDRKQDYEILADFYNKEIAEQLTKLLNEGLLK